MNKLIYCLIMLVALLSASCDRFDHAFKPAAQEDLETRLFEPLQSAFDASDSADVAAVMAFYDDDYLHNSQQKADREAWFLDLLDSYPNIAFNVQFQSVQPFTEEDTLALVTWRLTASDNNKVIVADSTFYGEEIIKRGSNWKLYGNRESCCPPVTFKQRVFIETFTYQTCPNCPIVESYLHELQVQNPYNLSYLEYHLNDPMDIGNQDVYGYYGYPAMPSVVFQGTNRLIIGQDTQFQPVFDQLVAQIAATDSKINLTNLDYVINGQTLSGSIRLDLLDQSLDANTFKLKYAILEKVSSYNNSVGDPCRNVVLAKGTKSLQGADLAQSVYFNLPFVDALPVDSYLAIWIQVTPDQFDNNAPIYNGIEAPINIYKHK